MSDDIGDNYWGGEDQLIDELNAAVDTIEQLREQVAKQSDEIVKFCGYADMHMKAQAQIAELEEKYNVENASVKTLCLDWAEEDTTIKAICAKFGIDTIGDSYGVPMMGECVVQLGEKAEAWKARVAVLEKALEILASDYWTHPDLWSREVKTALNITT